MARPRRPEGGCRRFIGGVSTLGSARVEGRTAASPGYVLAEYALVLQWSVGAAFDFAAGRWSHGVFGAVNVGFALFAIGAFVGFRASCDDLLAPFRSRGGGAPAVVPAALAAEDPLLEMDSPAPTPFSLSHR